MSRRSRRADYHVPINCAVKMIREAIGWTIARMAQEMGATQSQWMRNEVGNTFSVNTIEKIRERTGIDPYVLAYAVYCDISKLPSPLQEKITALKEEWLRSLELMRRNRQMLPTQFW